MEGVESSGFVYDGRRKRRGRHVVLVDWSLLDGVWLLCNRSSCQADHQQRVVSYMQGILTSWSFYYGFKCVASGLAGRRERRAESLFLFQRFVTESHATRRPPPAKHPTHRRLVVTCVASHSDCSRDPRSDESDDTAPSTRSASVPFYCSH